MKNSILIILVVYMFSTNSCKHESSDPTKSDDISQFFEGNSPDMSIKFISYLVNNGKGANTQFSLLESYNITSKGSDEIYAGGGKLLINNKIAKLAQNSKATTDFLNDVFQNRTCKVKVEGLESKGYKNFEKELRLPKPFISSSVASKYIKKGVNQRITWGEAHGSEMDKILVSIHFYERGTKKLINWQKITEDDGDFEIPYQAFNNAAPNDGWGVNVTLYRGDYTNFKINGKSVQLSAIATLPTGFIMAE